MEARKLLFELSHPVRYEILHLLAVEPIRLTKIAEKVDANVPEISRHLDRLKEVGIVEKNLQGEYGPAPMGILVLNYLPGLEFLSKYAEFFQTHNLSLLPPHFISRMGELKYGELKEGAFTNINIAKNIIRGSKKRLLAASKEYLHEIVPDVNSKLDKGLYYRGVVDESFLDNELDKISPREMANNIFKEVKVVQEIPAAGVVTESEAIMVFLGRDGKLDYSMCFYSPDEAFKGWCGDLFEHLWKEGRSLKGTLNP
jgi:predicted transcriptional regulator